jgi:CHAT domain/SIR2-like domain
MSTYPDLEIGLHRREAEVYSIDLRFSHPGGKGETRPIQGELPRIQADLAKFRQLVANPAEYGTTLWTTFFGEPKVQSAIAQALAAAQACNLPLRVRLFIGPSAPELHKLCWETLRHADTRRSLLTDENLLFSRYLSSADWKPIELRPRSDLRALVVVANPEGLESEGLAPVDVEAEVRRAMVGLGTIEATQLASLGAATLESIISHLRDDYDILYLVAHGALNQDEPLLWLETESGAVARVPGSTLAARMGELAKRPRLVVLASCQSAGAGEEVRSSDRGALAPLGPRLAEIGVPAVLAMQGDISMKSVAEFIPIFFKELQRDGLIDRAVAAARGAIVGNRLDWWAPTLYMRLQSGRIWYVPGFQDDPGGFKKWPTLLGHIAARKSVPILGPGTIEPLVGSTRDIARQWAEFYHYPMALHERDDLPSVAQYLAVNQDKNLMRMELAASLRREILRRHGRILAGESPIDINALLQLVWERRWAKDKTQLHRVLAKLPLEIYATTTPDNLLAHALADEKRIPEVDFCRWNDIWDAPKSIFRREPDYRPSKERPLVYHLFGCLEVPESVPVTEDDFADYLIGVAKRRDAIPKLVRSALVNSALLFIGFHIHDWPFRVLFRSILQLEGYEKGYGTSHVAVQIDPEGQLTEPEGARDYLKHYCRDASGRDANVSIYWGGAEDFARELQQRIQPVAAAG